MTDELSKFLIYAQTYILCLQLMFLEGCYDRLYTSNKCHLYIPNFLPLKNAMTFGSRTTHTEDEPSQWNRAYVGQIVATFSLSSARAHFEKITDAIGDVVAKEARKRT